MPCITFSGLSSAPSIVRSHDRAGGRAIYGESEALNLRRLSRKVPGPGAELPITYFAHNTTAVRDDRVGALRVLAARDKTAKRCSAAGQDRVHHLQLCVAHGRSWCH